MEDEDVDDDKSSLDHNPKDSKKHKTVIQIKLRDAKENGLSEKVSEVPKSMRCVFSDTVHLKLAVHKPADIDPLKITLKPDAVSIRAKKRLYLQSKQEVMICNLCKLLKLSSVKYISLTHWVSAPLISPRRPPAKCRKTADSLSVKSVTSFLFCPVHSI